MMNTAPHLVRVYLDPFTLPMLQQLLHFCRHSEEENTTSLTCWGRSVLLSGSQLHSRHQHIKLHMAPSHELYGKLMELKQEHGRIEIEIHSNQTYSPEILAPFINTLHFLRYPVRQIHLYEDGTHEYTNLLLLDEYGAELSAMLATEQAKLERYLYDTPRSTPLPYGFTGPGRSLFGWCWHHYYPTRYHMVRPDILAKLPGLHDLATELFPHLVKTDWSQFQSLASHQQEWVFQALGLERKAVEAMLLEHPNPLVVTGTAFNSNEKSLAEQSCVRMHQDVIKRIKKSGTPYFVPGDYTLLYKGHPGAPRVNSLVLNQNRKLVELPARLPVELMLMLGVPLHGVCGFVSTAYLSLSREQIRFVAIPAYTEEGKEKTLRNPPSLKSITNSYTLANYTLPRLLLLLGNADESQLVFYRDLFKRGELPFPAWSKYKQTQLMATRSMNDVKSGSGALMPPKKNLTLGFHIAHPDEFVALEKSLDSLIRMGFPCVLVIDETSPDFAAVCDHMATVTRQDLQAFTLAAVKEAGFRFDCFAAAAGRDDLSPYGYHRAEYGTIGGLGTQSQLIQAILDAQKKYMILM